MSSHTLAPLLPLLGTSHPPCLPNQASRAARRTVQKQKQLARLLPWFLKAIISSIQSKRRVAAASKLFATLSAHCGLYLVVDITLKSLLCDCSRKCADQVCMYSVKDLVQPVSWCYTLHGSCCLEGFIVIQLDQMLLAA